MQTIKQALNFAASQFIDEATANLDAQVLLCHVLDVERVYLFAHPEQTLTTEQSTQFDEWVQRRANDEPIAYILGNKGFYDLEFIVTPDVLIPRPETELLVEMALEIMHNKTNPVVADIGTGSGAIAVTLAHHALKATVFATDISPKALNIAQQNANQNKAKVTFLEGNLAQSLVDKGINADVLCANLPYIDKTTLSTLDVTKHEPLLALDGGDDGLDFIRELLRQIPSVMVDNGVILLEIGWDQGERVQQLAKKQLSVETVEVFKDYADFDRIVKIQL